MDKDMDVEESQDLGFKQFLNEIYHQVAKKPSQGFARWQQAAWKKFLALGLPTKKNEAFRYVRFKDLYEKAYNLSDCVEENFAPVSLEARYRIIFVNGQFSSYLSSLPKGCLILPLSKAFSTFGSLLQNHFERWIENEKNPFIHLNLSSTEGIFLYIPPKLQIESSIQFQHIYTEKNNAQYSPIRLHLFMGRQSSMELIETTKMENSSLFVNNVFDIVLEEGSSLKLRMLTPQNSSQNWSHFGLRATLKRDSRLHCASLFQGGLLRREDYHVTLAGENCEANLMGGWFLNHSEENHTSVLIEHQAPNCQSLQTFKGILNDKSRSSFEGKILVHEKAQKTQAYQMNKNLLLSNLAQAFSKPNLEIFADDVKASHGATMGQLNEEELFYLKSRGIPLEIAKNLLIRGFVQEILEPFQSLFNLISPKITGL